MRHAALIAALLAGCASGTRTAQPDDGRFAGLQSRGAMVMGVDQYSSTHRFDDRADGGEITLTRNDTTDRAGAAVILAHLRSVADSFTHGVFVDPATVHGMTVPGTETMARKRALISYTVESRVGGGTLRIRTTDAEAVAAVHAFLAFQRLDHRAGGHAGHGVGER